MKMRDRLVWVRRLWWNYAAASVQEFLYEVGVLGSTWRTRTEFRRCWDATKALILNEMALPFQSLIMEKNAVAWQEVERHFHAEYGRPVRVKFDTLYADRGIYFVYRRKV